MAGTALILALACQGCGGGGGATASGSGEVTSSVSTGASNGSATGTSSTATAPAAGGATQQSGVAKLSWNPPQEGAAGFKVYYGSAPGSYGTVLDVGLVQGYTVSGLAPGTYYFCVTTYDATGYESPRSNELYKTIN
ncbi:hypothetical protein GMLC_26730 [Geomonas limicola]|uniref:Fibronectin type-III domain-containing protein n=1 Tax=Geomonas limicola TaxID=2740186 RepID=A0A6V8NB59_9BACT|nr:hypothetical protein GMLC_26730 [Geomonas limicola]